MKSVASRFFTTSHISDSTVSVVSDGGFNCRQKQYILSSSTTNEGNDDECVRRLHYVSSCRPFSILRPIFIGPLLRAPRVSEAAVLLDGVPCGSVCFSGRVVRCEGSRGNWKNGVPTTRPFTAMLLSDTTGIIPVMQFYATSSADSVGAALQNDFSLLDEDAAEVIPSLDNDAIRENDYVFVMGVLVFADISKDVRRVVQGATDFVAGDAPKAIDNCCCVRGTVRLIDDMNELNYWALSALETHVRLMANTGGTARVPLSSSHTTKKKI